VLPCRSGSIYPHGPDTLALEIDGHTHLTRKVLAIPGTRLGQDGAREKTIVFHVSLFDRVVRVVKPCRRRRCHLSPVQRAANAERLRAHRFTGRRNSG
jgi:hypothetical protein